VCIYAYACFQSSMLVVSLSRIVLLLVILILIAFLTDNGKCDRDDDSKIYLQHRSSPQFRASHSPSYDYIYIPGTKKTSISFSIQYKT
jgi:hypothetical protein